MRRIVIALALLLLATTRGQAADAPSTPATNIKGIYMVAPYPGVTIAGSTASVDLKLRNYGLAPEALSLSVSGLPSGWTAQFLGSGQPVTAAMPSTNDSVDLTLRLDIPDASKGAAANLVVHADGPTSKAALPLKVTQGSDLPVSLDVKAELPSLRGTPTTTFSFNLDVRNNSGRDLVVSLAADAPKGFQAAFNKQYDTQEISSLPLKAGASQTVVMKMTLPNKVTAGSYKATARISSGGGTATADVNMDIAGQPKLVLSTPDGRLSGTAEAGKETPIQLQITNTGSAAARTITLSGSPPGNWKVEFDPKTIDGLAPDGKATVQAKLTPGPKTIAGDYVTSFTAGDDSSSSSADFRVTVTTSTIWGVIGIGIVAIALLALLGVVARFGRR